MASMAQRLWKAGNAASAWTYRRTGGKVGGTARGGSPVLLLTVAGRESGMPRTVPVAYVERDGAYPSYAPYEAKSGRRIAVERLTPTA